jgi:hypothetical protein
MMGLVEEGQAVAEIFWRDTLIDSAMFRDWIVNVGQLDQIDIGFAGETPDALSPKFGAQVRYGAE